MKTTNKIQKTALTAALTVSLSILGFSIDAQVENELLRETNSANNFAMAPVERSNYFFATNFSLNNSTLGSTFAAYLEKENDAPLNIEEWMLNDASFSSLISIEAEIETPMELESWMMDEKAFNVSSLNIETATDEQLRVEDWMMDVEKFEVNLKQEARNVSAPTTGGDYIFINNISFPKVSKEKNLELEDWMINSKMWK